MKVAAIAPCMRPCCVNEGICGNGVLVGAPTGGVKVDGAELGTGKMLDGMEFCQPNVCCGAKCVDCPQFCHHDSCCHAHELDGADADGAGGRASWLLREGVAECIIVGPIGQKVDVADPNDC